MVRVPGRDRLDEAALTSYGEVLQQHVMHVLGTDGSRNEVNAAVYFRFDGDLIDRIEEYGYQIPA